MARKFYLTTAIDYVNSKPHLGTAYEKVAADCMARSHRLLGRDVLFVMGNDEHSLKVEKSAREAGLTPQAYCDEMEKHFEAAWSKLGISHDDFIRTSEERHHRAVREILRRVREAGHITRDKYTGWYCEGCEAFYTEKDLVDGKCPNHATEPQWVEEENWFFKLSEFREKLLDHIEKNPDFIRPRTRRNEIVSFLEAGLNDLSISRSGIDWGIPFPDDPTHVVYVWFDALTNYISAAGFATDDEKFAKWWPADVHVVGKDITRFHCVIWPAMLMAAGLELPRSVFGHGFIYHSGAKMSKSLGNIVNPLDVVEITGADPLRYFLLREITFGNDGDFTWANFVSRYNADLANDLGNLVKRTTDMTAKFLDGAIDAGAGGGTDLRAAAAEAVRAASEAYEEFDLSGALAAVWVLVRRANQTIQETKPWELARDNARRAELAGVLADLLESIRITAALAEPALPHTVRTIRERIGRPVDSGPWESSAVWAADAGWQVAPGDPVFPRLDHAPDDSAPPDGGSTRPNPGRATRPSGGTHESPPGTIDIATFKDVKLVVATVKEARRVEGADRLLRLRLDLGGEERQVVSGIADHFSAEELTGRQVVVVANLKPAKIRGVESQGMILVAQADGRMTLVSPGGDIPPGAVVS